MSLPLFFFLLLHFFFLFAFCSVLTIFFSGFGPSSCHQKPVLRDIESHGLLALAESPPLEISLSSITKISSDKINISGPYSEEFGQASWLKIWDVKCSDPTHCSD
ncbi:hypothetical protein SELMODRAFT_411710 [Selaginella moellendorffii]|uniref:Uncharacterized protein n=1 Tax=Selaginella moellendorffii TaxID=88036 RepID=D8RIT0_SELML|nr:hypothetical protein SELMODRAFT_411710 [Selaginella moellendorffii]